jgi:hypothetical protein
MLSACTLVLVVALAGCGGAGPDATTTVTTDEPTTAEQPVSVEHSVFVFDGSDEENPVIEEGLTLEDGPTIEARVNQSVFDPEENLRLELSPHGSDEYSRYQIRAHVEGGTWTPPRVRGNDRDDDAWIDLGDVADVTPQETYRTPTSEDMEEQEATGTEE